MKSAVFIALIFYCACALPCKAQTTFQKTWGGGAKSDAGYDIAPALDGNFVVTGSTYNSTLSCNNILLMKVNPMGDTLWTKVYGTSGGQNGSSVIATNDGGYLIASTAGGLIGGNDMIILKTDSIGNLQWSKMYGGTYSEYVVGSMEVSNGYILLCNSGSFGYIDSTKCDRDEPGNFCPNICLIKINPLGDTLWTRVIYNEIGNWNDAYNFKKTNDGGFLVVGQSRSFFSGGSAIALKLDSLGILQWSKVYKTKFTYARDIIIKDNGRLVLLGYGYRGSPILNTTGIVIAETDSTGNLQWVKITDNNNDTTQLPMVGPWKMFTINDNYYVIGQSTQGVVSDSVKAGIVLILDTIGNIKYKKGYGFNSPDSGFVFYNLRQVNSNDFLITGTMQLPAGQSDVSLSYIDSMGNSACLTYDINNLTMLNIPVANIPQIDTGFFVGATNLTVLDYPLQQGYPQLSMKDCQDFSVGVIDRNFSKNDLIIKLNPNPNNSKFILEINDERIEGAVLSVFNILGEKIYNSKINKSVSVINIANQPKGIYFIQVQYKEMFFSQKLVVE